MHKVTVHSFEELQEIVFKDCFDAKTQRYRNNKVFRGVDDDNYSFFPKLNRICAHDLELEAAIIRSFKKYGYADIRDVNSFWQILAMGQHYGLPTRLLDWTYSPLVAAHFVTENIFKYDCDGSIFALDLEKTNRRLPSALAEELNQTGAHSFTIEMLERHAKNFAELKALSREPFFVFYEPAMQSERMINQYALFSMTSDVHYALNELIPAEDDALTEIVIPKAIKLEIRDKLDYINISERVIYPGLDGICSWITRRYADLGHQNKERK